MKKCWKSNPYICASIAAFITAAALMVFYRIISDFAGVGAVLSTIADVLLPFIVGLALAYLLLPIYNFAQRASYTLWKGKGGTPRRGAHNASKIIASVVSMVFLFAIIVGLLSLVIPQAIQSVEKLVESMPGKVTLVIDWAGGVYLPFSGDQTLAQLITPVIEPIANSAIDWAKVDLLPNLGNIAKDVSAGVVNVLTKTINVIVGVIICVYTLNSKTKFAAQAKKITYSLFRTPTANYIVHMTRQIDHTFGRYINGMLLDALMVGCACFIVMSVLRLPYAMLISAIVGAFNIVPIFGPIVAAIIGTLFVLMEDPFKAVLFLAVVLVLQQIDGNILAPKILGQQTGLSSFWVIFAILVGGGLFGVIGMIFGVPMFAVVYTLVQQWVAKRLQKKNIPDDTAVYDGLLEMDEETGEPIYENTDIQG